jgi:hypothetical protein
LFVNLFFLACGFQFRHTNSYAELFVTLIAYEHKRLTVFVFGLVEQYIVLTFRTPYSLHLILALEPKNR